MLVLSRQKDESIIINENIVVTVVEIRGDKVRLGIQAPRETPVHRTEVQQAIRAEQGLPPIELPIPQAPKPPKPLRRRGGLR